MYPTLLVGDHLFVNKFLYGPRIPFVDLRLPGLRKPGDPEDQIIEEVTDIEAVMGYADDSVGKYSVGGMETKLQAIKIALDAGVDAIIASGQNPEQLPDLVAGKGFGTRFSAP